MNPMSMIVGSRVEVASHLYGEVVAICDDEVYEDIFGLHLGCFVNSKWDAYGMYIFHRILSSYDGTVHNVCMRRNDSRIFKVIK